MTQPNIPPNPLVAKTTGFGSGASSGVGCEVAALILGSTAREVEAAAMVICMGIRLGPFHVVCNVVRRDKLLQWIMCLFDRATLLHRPSSTM